MRTMKRVAAVALSVVVLMTSGVSAKAAVTDVQPAKSSSEAVLKWAKKVGEPFDEKTYANNTVSKIKLVGNYLYVDDAKHRIMKIDKKDGTILKEQKYCDESYIQGYVSSIGYGDGKVYVGYDNGRVQAFDENTLESLWITDENKNAINSDFVFTNGKLYFGTTAKTTDWYDNGAPFSYYVVTTSDDDKTKPDEEKTMKKVVESKTGKFYLKKGVVLGKYIVISDTVKEDAKEAIAAVKKQGIITAMLTGDAQESADAVAKETGIDEVHAKLLPQDKLSELKKIRESHGAVMFVGDGINDAPVLAGADVGAAMGSGADAAIEAADVVFMNSEMKAIPEAVSIAKMTNSISWQNVVFALAMAVKAYTAPGDAVLIQSPVYYPFSEVIADNGRRVVSSTLVLGNDNRYHMDVADFEEKLKAENVKLFFLCNPHNPVGRVWTKEELTAIGDLCVQYGVTVVSDEIHGDFIFKGEHQVFAAIKKEYEDITITCTAPSKTFNLASMMMSNIFIANPELRAKFRKQLDAAGTSQLGVMGLVACETAYNKGDEWYEAMLSYVKANAEFTRQYVEEQIPGVKMIDLEGTYLVWLDFRETGLSVDELEDLIINKAKLWLDSGKIFGDCGRGFQRINIACPRATLTEALERIRDAMKSR